MYGLVVLSSCSIYAGATWHYFLKNKKLAEKIGRSLLGGMMSSGWLSVIVLIISMNFLYETNLWNNYFLSFAFIVFTISLMYPIFVLLYQKVTGIKHYLTALVLYSSLTLIENITYVMLPVKSKYQSLCFIAGVMICYIYKHKDFELLISNLEEISNLKSKSICLLIHLLTISTYIYTIGVRIIQTADNLSGWDQFQFAVLFCSFFVLTLSFVFIKVLLKQVNIGFYNKNLADSLRDSDAKALDAYWTMLQSQENVIEAFASILDSKSRESGGHVKRVALYSEILAKELGYSKEEADFIRIASMMHDVGKILIPNEILEKPSKLTSEEWEEMKMHVIYGDQILRKADGKLMEMARNIAREHHERWDGKGYVLGLKGNEISMEAQIVQVADVFDALTSKRSYKSAWAISEAFIEIIRGKGTQFSPIVVDAFIRSILKFAQIRNMNPEVDYDNFIDVYQELLMKKAAIKNGKGKMETAYFNEKYSSSVELALQAQSMIAASAELSKVDNISNTNNVKQTNYLHTAV
ncbi:HD-GYP domain-containing protein [Butyrivibrio sp. NC3005]|uniref:HD-GYP domain-containing protein n=1 Tax=Butyrivibrio sp. NC3005 TaxID=1280685 RepID=UPI000685ED27|nr:HD domain-containing phosphohydrolase [Butyrivibrio sp. NC3005]